eukprot:TRINITY_DN31937_c0_g1_i1.p1 TRINITY_DN31937_c0_g1~~TRINITY_DN31937_c0_g1_i1.p1  ORF type:complete len:190 (-),score=43.81 TRINITY_DN31937_c0_g1_i1:364-933(-)
MLRSLVGSEMCIRDSTNTYESNLEAVGSFDSVSRFWQLYNHLKKPDQVELNSNYHLFKEGIKPMWEDPANEKGGKWVLNLRNQDKHMISHYWENLVLGLIGESIDMGDEITGAVVARRRAGDRIAIWTRSAHDEQTIMQLGENIQAALDAPRALYLEFQSHEDSLKTGSSYSSQARYSIGPQPPGKGSH